MRADRPIADLHEEVAFTLHEAVTLLFVADIPVELATEGSAEHLMARRAQRLAAIADLGDILDDGDEVDECVDSVTRSDAKATVPDLRPARRLKLPGDDVYRLVFLGELVGGPDKDGAVYVSVPSVHKYLVRGTLRGERSIPDTSRPTGPTA